MWGHMSVWARLQVLEVRLTGVLSYKIKLLTCRQLCCCSPFCAMFVTDVCVFIYLKY